MTTIESGGSEGPLRISPGFGGGLVLRPGGDGHIRVAVVHRHLEDEWSFPKGKRRPGEAILTTALRAVREDAGFLCVAEAQLGSAEQADRRGGSATVAYWAMNRVTGGFTPSSEVDSLQWLRPSEARLRLSSENERSLLGSVLPVLITSVRRRQGEVVSSV